jgi:hypothetical protein
MVPKITNWIPAVCSVSVFPVLEAPPTNVLIPDALARVNWLDPLAKDPLELEPDVEPPLLEGIVIVPSASGFTVICPSPVIYS